MTVIIIGAILLILIFTLGVSSFFSRYNVLDAENKRASLELAEGCVNGAMLKIAQNPAYVPAATGDCVSEGGTCGASGPQRTCKICSVSYSGSTATIITRASYNHAYTNIYAKADTTPGAMVITYWSEKAASGVSTCTVP